MKDELIIGQILKPQGIKGELKYKPFMPEEKLASFSTCKIAGKAYTVENNVIRFGFGYIKLLECTDRNQAELFRNKQIMISREEFGDLKNDEYFIEDLIGCQIVFDDGKSVGVIKKIEEYGSAPVFVIKTPYAFDNVPYLKKIFYKVDIASKTIFANKTEYDNTKC